MTAPPGGFSPTKTAAPLAQPPGAGDALLHRPCRDERRLLRQQLRAQGAQRRDVVDDPDAAAVRGDDEVVVARLDDEVAHGDRGELVALEAGPGLAAVDRDPQAELGAEEQQVRLLRVFLDDVRVAADAACVLRRDERLPGLAVVARHVEPRVVIAERVAVERRVSRGRIVPARLDPADPRGLRQALEVAGDVRSSSCRRRA